MDDERRKQEKEDRDRKKRDRIDDDDVNNIDKKLRELRDKAGTSKTTPNKPTLPSTPSRSGGEPMVPTPRGSAAPPKVSTHDPAALAAAKALQDAAAAAAADSQIDNTPASVKKQINGDPDIDDDKLNTDDDDISSDDELSDDSDLERERLDRRERQDRHKKLKKKYSDAIKEGATVVIRSSDKSDLVTEDFQIINLGVTKFLEENLMKGINVGVGRGGMYQGFVWYPVTNQTTMDLFEKYIPTLAPPPGKTHKYLLGPRDDLHKVYTCYIDQFYWEQKDVLERRLRLFTPNINLKVKDDSGLERLAHLKIISGGVDKQREIGPGKNGFIVRLELEECLARVLVEQAEKGLEGRVLFTAGSSVELQGNGIELKVKEKQDKDAEEARLRKERREKIREKKRKRMELLRQKQTKK